MLESQVKDLLAAKTDSDAKIENLLSGEEKLRQTSELMEGDQRAFKIVKEKLCRVCFSIKKSNFQVSLVKKNKEIDREILFFLQEIGELEDKLQVQSRELKESSAKSKLATSEIADLNEKYERPTNAFKIWKKITQKSSNFKFERFKIFEWVKNSKNSKNQKNQNCQKIQNF